MPPPRVSPFSKVKRSKACYFKENTLKEKKMKNRCFINSRAISEFVMGEERNKPVSFIIRSRDEFEDACRAIQKQLDRDSYIEFIARETPGVFQGFCSQCNRKTHFIVEKPWTTYTEGVICSRCKLNSRLRLVFDISLEFFKNNMVVYTSEYITPFLRC